MLVAFGVSLSSNFKNFASKTYEHSVFIDIIKDFMPSWSKRGNCKADIERLAGCIHFEKMDLKNSPEVNAFWNDYNNTDIQRKRKLWQIESTDLDYICKRDRQLEKEIKLIRDERIKAQYSELTQSQFVETNAPIMSLSSILNDPVESYSTIAPNNDGVIQDTASKTMQKTITTPQKPILCDKVMQYLDNHFSINVNKQCVIMKVDNVDTFPKEIRSWLIDVLSAIQSVYREYTFDWIEVQANCIKDAKMLFPNFDLKLNKVDGIGLKVSSTKEVVFIEVSGGPENAILKHVREDTEKLIKEGMFGLVALLRDFLDKNAENARNICTYMVQCIDFTIKSAILQFSFEEVEKFIENGLKNQTSELKKLMLADFNTGSNEPTIRDWVWVPDTLSTWEDTE
ncbi:hypothetical protein F8M41_003694 [Gigaspora margarita]|uniref:Uncharacterized protein n=1 Tax=Gigaspora margarita TaxID=4874 RepID=A0A8H3XAX9_GIGMA|nr:hypothetical protein F8M41_003694 [Gigaspora margarita]